MRKRTSKWNNRLLAGFLALLMVVSLVPMPVRAEETGDAVALEQEAPQMMPQDGQEDAAPEPELGQKEITGLTVSCDSSQQIDGTLVGKEGDTFLFKAYDQDGNETPVKWSTSSSWVIKIDEDTGIATVTGSLSPGSTSYLYIKAVSTENASISAEGRFSLTSYQFSTYNRNQTVTLPEDGQTEKKMSFSGGYKGHSIWSYDEAAADGIASLVADPGKETSMQFLALRPGTFTVTVKLDIDESMTDTATAIIAGVAVETLDGTRKKTYLEMGAKNPNPTVQLSAYCAQGRTVSTWTSSNDAIAAVDENGLVTAKGVGTALIQATDNEGAVGGIQVVVQSTDEPYFEALEFMTSAFASGTWTAGKTFSPTKLSYDLPIRAYSTSTLTLQDTTLFDTEKYTAVAEYTDIHGDKQSVQVNSGASTALPDQPFDDSVLTITLSDKTDGNHKTVYTFHVTRPRDETKALKNSTGITLVPDGRSLLSTKYQGKPEGAMLQADEEGNVKGTSSSMMGTYYNYRTYALDKLQRFSLLLTGSTAYQHIRYRAGGSGAWKELPQGGGTTDVIAFPEGGVSKVQVQILDDKTYAENVAAGHGGFDDGTPNTYTVWVEQVATSAASAQILSASTEIGDWYPAFDREKYSYNIIVPSDTSALTLKYTVTDGATVKLGMNEQAPAEDGSYTLNLATYNQTLDVTSEDGQVTNSYVFKYQKKSGLYDVPDKVVDYLVINSQYTNGGTGANPEATLAASLKSLGNFGGYITYYYDRPLTDDPTNRYGIDFYVYGNAAVDGSTSTGMSFFEPGQVWVSENGETWYALAGSAHYDDGVDWNYTVDYTRTSAGKTAWSDNHGNSNDGNSKSGSWPSSSVYYMNSLADQEMITLSGIVLPAADGTIPGNGGCDAYPVNWGYADTFANGTMGEDVNPYLDNKDHKLKANGFDLSWAVDDNGVPVDVSGKKFHYVKVVTASNIWHGAFGEKSTEVTAVVRTKAQDEKVGVTSALQGVTLTDGASTRTVSFTEGQQVYKVDLDDMKYVSLSINGASEDDNIYVNNQRIAANESVSGIKVTEESQEKLIRILVQNGDKEPVIYLLKLTSSATDSDTLIEDVKLNLNGAVRKAGTNDGIEYTATVGYRIDSVKIVPVADPDIMILINGEEIKESYSLAEGENLFRIQASRAARADMAQEILLSITREAAPAEAGTAKVYFTLLGDTAHGEPAGEDEIHTLSKNNLQTWIAKTEYTLKTPATVMDVLEAALKDKGIAFENDGGNYIAELNGLAAFDNGTLSGWLYTLNGIYPSFGVAEQEIKDGDEIVFHYTDDYSAENRDITVKAAEVEKMIDELPAVGDLTLADSAAVQKAAEAFRLLGEGDQKLVPEAKRQKLDAAVQKIALLRKEKQEAFENIYKKTAEYLSGLADQYAIQAGTEGGEWMAIGLARSGKLTEKQAADYYANVEKFVKENINEKEQLHRSKSTENSRVILGLTAIGKDVTDVDGHNLLAGLSDLTYLKRQGINGPIWALIALDSHGYEIPALVGAGTQTTRENLVETILAAQLADGGWALAGTEADADVTAMAIQALAPYYESNSKVREAVDTAVDKLSHMQNPDGSYTSSGTTNAEACVQVIVALTALGIDPVTDSRFTKNGNSVMDALLGFYVGNGGFAHTTGGTINGMATEQAYYAMAAYSRMMSGQNSLYDMSDVAITKTPAAEPGQSEKNPSKDSDKSQNKANPTSPQTGDEQSDMYVFLMMLGFAAGIAGLAFGKKRRAL